MSLKRIIAPWDPFFDLGNLERELWVKKASYASYEAVKEASTTAQEQIACGIDGCKAVFSSSYAYEVHYNSAHLHKCSVCSRAMPSCRLLSLHIMEAHDSFFHEMAKRENMYECLVEGCNKKFKGDFQRERHLIDAHKFPQKCHFVFHPTRAKRPKDRNRNKKPPVPDGEGRNSDGTVMNSDGAGRSSDGAGRNFDGGRKGKGPQHVSNMEADECGASAGGAVAQGEQEDVEMADLCNAMKGLKTPTTIRFGRGSASSFWNSRGHFKSHEKDRDGAGGKERDGSRGARGGRGGRGGMGKRGDAAGGSVLTN